MKEILKAVKEALERGLSPDEIVTPIQELISSYLREKNL